MKQLLLVLLISHVLGDFYLQSEPLALRKDTHRKSLLRHLWLYAVPFVAMAALHRFSAALVLAGGIAVLFHALIDFEKARLTGARPSPEKNPAWSGRIYLVDQSLHWLSLVMIAFALRSQPTVTAWPFLNELIGEFDLTWALLLQWTLALLLIYRPSNITFIKLFSIYKPSEGEIAATDAAVIATDKSMDKVRTGGIIGVLEKLLALIFLSVGEYMAIGLVLTAKSIARYDRISKSASFAEYYLIGTLSSIIMVLLIYVLCFQMLS